ncbi:uncharacterized protein TRIADDRAFT_25051 [Trichoplax adhaerens]|uniref:Bardet-Biedl syndrome 7 protein homolog n=1 Tax=Trichoplax adhaerens TaxID=10228 RepID=B3RXC9_TRIAD|nr:hypothetical protein TRIADDRAFT_25051 [Trichoplax adhaerens]EDV24847.1 hypothetical protein TRIADDRAFT_25051 [Trichoplax adhaerens]|eukprot:XP_002112737.1 hypothetical protein TRIADDRAFT_25051 [Trichoplax adhaerens]
MEIELTRSEYIQVGVTSPKTTKILPMAKEKHGQKVVVADHEGAVTCFQMKRGDASIVFKTLPGPKITRLELGGPLGNVQDRIFVSCGPEIRGYNKKGKQFLNFDTNLTESIQTMAVYGSDLFLCGNYIYNHYRDCKDFNYYLSTDRINDTICVPSEQIDDVIPILACQDRVLRVIRDSDLRYQVDISGSPTCTCLMDPKGEILYGTSDGLFGVVHIGPTEPLHRWELPNDDNLGGVLCMESYDLFDDGKNEILVGRDDGLLQIYGYDETGDPEIKCKSTFSESITSVAGGRVANVNVNEAVVSTYAGWITGISVAQNHQGANGDYMKSATSEENQMKVDLLKSEIEELQVRIARERENYQYMASTDNRVSAVPQFSINDKFVLNGDDASYHLTLEVQMPIDNVLLQSDVPVDLLDLDKNSAVVSFSDVDIENGNHLLATYRCQANTTRLELKIRSIEGQYGTLQAYITPRCQPKSCQVRQYDVKPLSLHQRISALDESRPFNVLQLSGQFSLAEIHSWINFCLPDMPERASGDSVNMAFRSTFLDTQLECRYKKGEGIFRSDNLSTIAILKDVMTKEATKKKINLNISHDINDDSIAHALNIIHPKMEQQLSLAKRVQIIDALKELEVSEGGTTCLSESYREILANAEQLREEFKKQPSRLERLSGMITDLYLDTYKFKGQSVKNKVPALLELLNHYNLDSLIDFFTN